jgi:hypothetical protein
MCNVEKIANVKVLEALRILFVVVANVLIVAAHVAVCVGCVLVLLLGRDVCFCEKIEKNFANREIARRGWRR